jgi:ABC-type Na+ efflux pump permease subunit
MRPIAAIARHDLRIVLTDKSAVVWLILMPVVFATFFGLVMGGGAGPSDGTAVLTVVDEDGGPVAAMLIEELESERLALNRVLPADKEATPNKVRTLVLPAGLSTSVLAGDQVTLRLEKEPDSPAEASLMVQARVVSAIATVLGRLIEASAGPAPGTELATGLPTTGAPADDLVVVRSVFAGEARVTPGGFAQSIPGNTVMFVMLVALTYGAASVAGERSSGRLRRLATTPLAQGEIVAGKVAGRLVIAVLQITILTIVAVVASRTVGIPIGDRPFATWIVLLAYAVAVAPLGVAFGARFTDPDRAASIGVIATLIMAAFGGCWWPLEVVSKPLQTVALAFPTGWAMRALHGTISFGRGIDGVLLPLAVLVGYSVLFSAIAVRSLRID